MPPYITPALRTLGTLLLLIAFWLPALSEPWPSFYKETFAISALLMWFLSIQPKQLHWFSLFLCTIAFTAVLQYASGLLFFIDDMLLPFTYLLLFILAFETGRSFYQNDKLLDTTSSVLTIHAIWWALLLAALLSALIAIRQWLGLATSDVEIAHHSARPYANLGQPNLLSTLLLLGACAVFALQQNRIVSGWLAILLTGFLLLAVAITQSRSAWIFIAFATLYLTWCTYTRRVSLPVWLPTLLALFFITCLASLQILSAYSDIPIVDISQRAAASSRLDLWKGIISAAFNGHWYGYGWMQGGAAQLAPAEAIHPGRMQYAHNLILDLWIWLGLLPGLVVALIGGNWLFIAFLRATSPMQIVGWLALAAFMIHSMLEFPFAYLYFLIPIGIILGYITANSGKLVFKLSPRIGIAFSLLFIVLIPLCSVVIIKEYQIIQQNQFNETLRRAKIIGFPEADIDSVRFLQSLKSQQLLWHMPTDKPLSNEETQLLEAVSYRLPTLANLARLGIHYSHTNNQPAVCETLSKIVKLYGKDSLAEAARVLSDIHPLDCALIKNK